MNFKGKNILVWGTGIEVDHCTRLAHDAEIVYYFTPWIEQQKFIGYAYGQGLASNIKKTIHFWDHVDEADLICFFDIGAGDAAKYLRKQGKNVFGGGDGEKFEEYRYKFRLLQSKIGLSAQRTTLIKGMSALRQYIKKNPNVFVKINLFRGDVESFHAKDFDSVEMIMDEIEAGFGPFKESFEFMVEEFIEGIEPGIDGFFNGKNWLWPMMWGWEINSSYIGKICHKREELFPPMLEVMDKLIPVLQKVDYRGPLSVEGRIPSNGKFYLTDMTMRMAFPLSLIYTEYLTNYSDVIWSCAKGENIAPEYDGKYLGCLSASSNHSKDYWVRLIFPEKLRKNLKLEYSCKVDKYYYIVKGGSGAIPLIANGNSYPETFTSLRGYSKKPDCTGYQENLQSLDEIEKVIAKSKRVGISF